MRDGLFAAFIGASQKGLCLTDAEMAEALDVSRSTISRWKKAKTLPDTERQLEIVSRLSVAMEAMDSFIRKQQNILHETGTDNPIDFPVKFSPWE